MKKMLLLFLAAPLLLPVGATAASLDSPDFGACSTMFPDKTPPISPRAGRPLCFNSFAVLYSAKTKTPVYSVEYLDPVRMALAKNEERTNLFFEDARLPSAERARLDDYRGSGYDRGHMAPAADMPNQAAMAQSFSLANIIPQDPENNRKLWASIEKATRHYAGRSMGVYVYTGPWYDDKANPTFVGNGVRVPDYIYKLVYDPARNKAWAYWVPNRGDARMSKPISYKALADKTGITFLPGVIVN